MSYTIEEYQQKFWDEAAEYFGTNIIGSDSHPMKEAFKTFMAMCKEEEELKKEEEEEEEEKEEEEEEEEVVYNIRQCDKCKVWSYNIDDVDCTACGATFCMMLFQKTEKELEELEEE